MNQNKSNKPSLYERVGGQLAIRRVVDEFFQFLLKDERVNVFMIEKVSDIAKLHRTIAQFLTGIMGGPQIYTGKSMKQQHKGMSITDYDFNLLWSHL